MLKTLAFLRGTSFGEEVRVAVKTHLDSLSEPEKKQLATLIKTINLSKGEKS